MKHPIILVLEDVTKPDNMGSLFRSALAFGVSGLLLSPRCTDPLYRKSIRTSMGAVFRLPYHKSTSWPSDLCVLKQQGYRLVAMHLKGSTEVSEALCKEGPIAILLGAE